MAGFQSHQNGRFDDKVSAVVSEAAQPLVLLLDDDELWLRTVARALKAKGATVVTMTTPERLFAAIEQGIAPDVMVIDYLLEHSLHGGDVTTRVLEKMRELTPPRVLLSGTLERVPQPELELFDLALAKSTELPVLCEQILRLARRNAKRASHTRLVGMTPEELAEQKARENTPV